MKNVTFILTVCTFIFLLPFIMGCPCENNTCDDGLFCNGVERCMQQGDQTVCSAGLPPCRAGETCDEEMDTCITGGQGECATLGNNGQTSSILSTSGALLDVPIPQVLLEAKLIGVDKDSFDDIGIDFPMSTEITTSDDEPTGAYSDESRDIVVGSDIVGGPEDTQYMVPGNQPGNGYLGYVNLNFIPRFEDVQVFMQLPSMGEKACVDFAEGNFTVPRGFPGLPGHENLPAEDRGYGGSMLLYNILDSNNLDLALQAIEAEEGTKILSNPKIVAYNGQRSIIMVNEDQPGIDEVQQGFAIPIQEVTNNPIAIFTGATLDLKVTPTINPDDSIELEIRIGTQAVSYFYSTPFRVNQVPADLQVPVVKPSKNLTKLIVPDGETIVIGGLLRQGSEEMENGVPGLGDIPFIGSTFESKQFDRTKQDFIILITPTVVVPNE